MKEIPEDNKYFHYYNANPKGKHTKDCTYRALSLFLDKSWEEIAKLDIDVYLKYGLWLYTTEYSYKESRFKSCLEDFLKEFSVKKYYFDPNDSTEELLLKKGSIKGFIDECADLSKIYLISTGGHMTVIKNKKVWDIFDCTDRGIAEVFVLE